jgi:hypothetical protein
VQLGGDLRAAEREVEGHAVLGPDGVFVRVEDEGGRRARRDLPLRRQAVQERAVGVVAEQLVARALVGELLAEGDHGIGEHGEVGT